jgi:hypothetical protein
MTAAAHGQEKIVLSGELDRIEDVRCSCATNNERGTPFSSHGVVDRLFAVSRITGFEQLSADRCRELIECGFVNARPLTINCRYCDCHEILLDLCVNELIKLMRRSNHAEMFAIASKPPGNFDNLYDAFR